VAKMSEKSAINSIEKHIGYSVFSLQINILDNSINDITTYLLTSCTNRAIINFIDVRGVTTNTLKAGKHPRQAINASSKAWAIHAATGKLTTQ
jgi:hypothetical protein